MLLHSNTEEETSAVLVAWVQRLSSRHSDQSNGTVRCDESCFSIFLLRRSVEPPNLEIPMLSLTSYSDELLMANRAQPKLQLMTHLSFFSTDPVSAPWLLSYEWLGGRSTLLPASLTTTASQLSRFVLLLPAEGSRAPSLSPLLCTFKSSWTSMSVTNAAWGALFQVATAPLRGSTSTSANRAGELLMLASGFRPTRGCSSYRSAHSQGS